MIDKAPDLNFVKKTHRFTHATLNELKTLITDTGEMKAVLKSACAKVLDALPVCFSSSGSFHR